MNRKPKKSKQVLEIPSWKYRGCEYRPHVKYEGNRAKIWHEVYEYATEKFMGSASVNPYNFLTYEEFVSYVDRLYPYNR